MKIYKKYELKSTFGLVTSGSVSVSKNSCLCFSNEFVLNWDLKTGELLTSNKMDSLVTFVKNKKRLAIGMVDGCVVVLNHLDSNINHAIESSIDNEIKLNGHSKFITWLEFDIEGNRLLSCSGDTDLVLWDLVLEQGLKRFQGHKDAVTCAKFVRDYILSTSKDGTLKIWDQLGICLETCLEHRGEIWSFDVLELDDKVLLVTGCADGACRVFELDLQVLSEKFKQGEIKRGLKFLGFLSRTNNEKITSIKIHEDYCGVQGGDRIVEIFKIKTLAELKRLESKKIKKMEKKGLEPIELGISDRISSHCIVNCSSHVKSFDIANEKHGLKVTCGLSNNSIESYMVDYIARPSRLQTQIQLPGHRNDIRTLCLSSDDQLLASGSHNQLKLWNVNTANCIVTFESGYCTASIFLPGNKHVLVGTKQGRLELYEVASGNLLEAQEAHQGSIWSIAMLPDKSGIASGGQDKTVKIWDFVLLEDIEYSKINKRPSVKHTKSLKLQDDILALKVSPCGKFLAVSLLDMTVKIFYLDSFKFFLNLYGHKLPVVTMDISFDSRLIITGSSDKTVKIWGLDFGDCHKSLLKHTDSVMQVQNFN